MYTKILSLMFVVLLTLSANKLFAQKSKIITDTMTVFGNCGECKQRIEDAANIKGVKVARWDKKTKLLNLTYNSSKTNLETITASINLAGHDTHKEKALDKNYKKLPACCAFRTGTCAHE